MFYRNTIGIWVLVIIQCFNLYKSDDPYEDPKTLKNFAMFHCHKQRTCTEGGDKVCGYDENSQRLAEFEDLCTMYKVNCERRGMYLLVESIVCSRQKEFEVKQNITDPNFSDFSQSSTSKKPVFKSIRPFIF